MPLQEINGQIPRPKSDKIRKGGAFRRLKKGYLHRHEENENIAPNVQPEIREATEAESKNTKTCQGDISILEHLFEEFSISEPTKVPTSSSNPVTNGPTTIDSPNFGQGDYCSPEPIPIEDCMKASVIDPGYISFHLRRGIIINVGPNYALQIINTAKDTSLALSGCATQMALIHPEGCVLQYTSRVEVHSRSALGEKNAKIWPRGISFTSSNCAIVYLVDEAGTRSTSDFFHDLYSEDITESIFSKSCGLFDAWAENETAQEKCMRTLQDVKFWQTEKASCWQIDDSCIIQQTSDGFVSVERKYGSELFTLKTSPGNGKARFQSSFIYVTASLGAEAHLFVKSKARRIHHSDKAFTVRNAGHSAGFDSLGKLRIY